ncbi:unnamed protein product, partial [Amoebophrya sp. A120]|eukprot:GSA120T00013591001.1
MTQIFSIASPPPPGGGEVHHDPDDEHNRPKQRPHNQFHETSSQQEDHDEATFLEDFLTKNQNTIWRRKVYFWLLGGIWLVNGMQTLVHPFLVLDVTVPVAPSKTTHVERNVDGTVHVQNKDGGTATDTMDTSTSSGEQSLSGTSLHAIQLYLGISWFFGFFIGMVIISPLADLYGRKKPLLYSLFVNLIASFAFCKAHSPASSTSSSTAPGDESDVLFEDAFVLCLLRAVIGGTVGGGGMVAHLLMLEICPIKLRHSYALSLHIQFAVGGAVVALLAYLIGPGAGTGGDADHFSSNPTQGDWQQLSLAIALISLFLFLPCFCFVKESVRWKWMNEDAKNKKSTVVLYLEDLDIASPGPPAAQHGGDHYNFPEQQLASPVSAGKTQNTCAAAVEPRPLGAVVQPDTASKQPCSSRQITSSCSPVSTEVETSAGEFNFDGGSSGLENTSVRSSTTSTSLSCVAAVQPSAVVIGATRGTSSSSSVEEEEDVSDHHDPVLVATPKRLAGPQAELVADAGIDARSACEDSDLRASENVDNFCGGSTEDIPAPPLPTEMNRVHLYTLCFAWFSVCLVYYGMSFSVEKLTAKENKNDSNSGSDSTASKQEQAASTSSYHQTYEIYLLAALLALVEIPACYLANVLMRMRNFGRRGSTFLFFIGSGVLSGLLNFELTETSSASTSSSSGGSNKNQSSSTALVLTWSIVLLGKLLITSAFALLYTYGSEVFHTKNRGKALAYQSASARIAGLCLHPILAFFSAQGTATGQNAVFLLFGGVSVVAGYCCRRFLPETRGKPMDVNLVSEEEEHGQKNSTPGILAGMNMSGLDDSKKFTATSDKRKFNRKLKALDCGVEIESASRICGCCFG